MKGLILAGGNGLRTGLPFNKYLLVYKGKTILEWCIIRLLQSKIDKIGIIIGGKDKKINKNIISKFEYSAEIFIQPKANGTAGALKAAQDWIDEDVLVVMADNYFSYNFDEYILNYYKLTDNHKDVALATTKRCDTKDAIKYSIFNEQNELKEKPHNNLRDGKIYNCYCGIMILQNVTIKERLASLKKSARGEYEITDLYNKYSHKNITELTCNWYDIGDLNEYGRLLLS